MTNGKNDFRFDDLVGKMKELGEQAGKGRDTQIKFGLLVVNAAYDGTIDDVKNKHGKGVDDITKLCSEYARAQATHTMFDAKSASSRVQMAKANTCRKLGAWTRGGPGEPIATVDKLLAMRDTLRRNPDNAKKLDDAYNTLLRYARFQLKPANVSTLVTDEDLLRSFCFKPINDTKTHEEVLQGIIKTLEDVRAGRAASGTVQDGCVQVQDAVAGLKARLSELRNAATAAVTPVIAVGNEGNESPCAVFDGTEGQDRESYSDDQDRESYAVDDDEQTVDKVLAEYHDGQETE